MWNTGLLQSCCHGVWRLKPCILHVLWWLLQNTTNWGIILGFLVILHLFYFFMSYMVLFCLIFNQKISYSGHCMLNRVNIFCMFLLYIFIYFTADIFFKIKFQKYIADIFFFLNKISNKYHIHILYVYTIMFMIRNEIVICTCFRV